MTVTTDKERFIVATLIDSDNLYKTLNRVFNLVSDNVYNDESVKAPIDMHQSIEHYVIRYEVDTEANLYKHMTKLIKLVSSLGDYLQIDTCIIKSVEEVQKLFSSLHMNHRTHLMDVSDDTNILGESSTYRIEIETVRVMISLLWIIYELGNHKYCNIKIELKQDPTVDRVDDLN